MNRATATFAKFRNYAEVSQTILFKHSPSHMSVCPTRFAESGKSASGQVTVRDHDAVVVIAADELERLLPPTSDTVPFVTFMESLSVDGLDLTRERDVGREIAL